MTNGPTPRIALIGNRSPEVRAHLRIPQLLRTLLERDGVAVDAYWLPSEDVGAGTVAGFDGVWAVPGSPYRSEAGALAAIRDARELGIPFLGTCGGFQHALLEFARHACGLGRVEHQENRPEASDCVIVELACSLVGHEVAVRVEPGTLAESVLRADRVFERYLCAYGPAERYLDVLQAHGLVFSGRDDAGDVRIVELPGHPFFLGTLFQPELAGDGTRAHPVVRAFVAAAADHAARRGDESAAAVGSTAA
jgi:CTP synthase (UTP-ammonia lyase)